MSFRAIYDQSKNNRNVFKAGLILAKKIFTERAQILNAQI